MSEMDVIREIHLHNGSTIQIGDPSSDELPWMWEMRRTVYAAHGYIEPGIDDRDEYDLGQCRYVTARLSSPTMRQIVGSARIILSRRQGGSGRKADLPLPTPASGFDFEEPEGLRVMPMTQRIEISRLIVYPKEGIPAHHIVTGLIVTLLDIAYRHNFLGGVGFVKRGFFRILTERLKIPIHELGGARLKYPRDGMLRGYFYGLDGSGVRDEAVAIWYDRDEVRNALLAAFGRHPDIQGLIDTLNVPR